VEIAGPVKADLNRQASNQNLKRVEGIKAGDTVTLQLFAEGLPSVSGYGLFIHYNTQQIKFSQQRMNANFIPGALERVLDVNGDINVALASFGGSQTSQGDGLLGEFDFVVQSAFVDSTTIKIDTIVLSRAGGLEELKQVTLVSIVKSGQAKTPDFNGDKRVDFVDFLLFANAFGGADAKFDLDNSGSVGFGDFLIFAVAFGTSVS
jgi:hypothetical protein